MSKLGYTSFGLSIFSLVLMGFMFLLAVLLAGTAAPHTLSLIGCSIMFSWLVWVVSLALGIAGLKQKETPSWPSIVGVAISAGGLLITGAIVGLGIYLQQ